MEVTPSKKAGSNTAVATSKIEKIILQPVADTGSFSR